MKNATSDALDSKRTVRDERGIALVVVLLATLLLTALALTLVMVTTTETQISANYRDAQESLYGADSAIERVLQDLLLVPQWNDILTGAVQSSFVGPTTATLADGTQIDVTREAARLQYETNALHLWGLNDPVWRVYANGPISEMLPEGIQSPVYVIVFVADDPSESDNDPQSDTNGVLTLHAEAWGVGGSHKAVEATVSHTSSTEIERGYVAQRGQEEWNQRARKAPVQTPGKSLSQMSMGVGTGGLQ